MGRRRTRSHLELREQFDAAERRKDDDEVDEAETDEEEGDEEEGDEEEGDEDEAAAEPSDEDEAGGDDDDEEAPKKKKKAKKPPKPVKEVKPKRTRAAKVVRMKVIWAVFNNSNQRVASYEYPKRKEADEHAARLMSEKKSTFFVQPVKEAIDEKKE